MTKTPKWMKGPYEVAKRGTYPADEGFKVIAPEQINSKGKPYRLYAAQFIPSEAEAHLFAAAPELYEALYNLVRQVRSYTPPENVGLNVHDAVFAGTRALAKARGTVTEAVRNDLAVTEDAS
jgi:hypothetical protein